MSNATQILIATTLSLTAACGYMVYRVDAASDQAAVAAQLAADQRVRIAQLDKERAALQREVSRLRGIANTWRTQPVTPPPATASAPRVVANAAPANNPVLPGETRRFLRNSPMGEWMQTEEGREMMQAQRKMGIQRMYADFFKEMNFSADQVDKFVSALAQQEVAAMSRMRDARGDREAMQRLAQERELRTKSEVTALLGTEGYKQFAAYQASFGERMELNQISENLEVMRVPLRDDQRSEMLSALIEERDRVPRPAFSAATTPEESMNKNLEWKQDYDQRVRDRVSSVLSSDQLKRVTDYQQMQLNMQRMSMQRFQAARRAAPDRTANAQEFTWAVESAPGAAIGNTVFMLDAPPPPPPPPADSR